MANCWKCHETTPIEELKENHGICEKCIKRELVAPPYELEKINC